MDDEAIRQARAEDRDGIVACVSAAYAKYVPRMGKEPAPMLADYAALIARGGVYVVGAPEAIRAVIVSFPAGDHYFLENVAVAPAHQGTGLGRALMEFVEEQARAGGYGEIRLYTHERMTENIPYYQRHGYVETERCIENGYHRLFFRKALTPTEGYGMSPTGRWREVETCDDDLRTFEAEGAPGLPAATAEGYVEHEGARLWYATYGFGAPVVLLHGGLGHSGNWGYQVPALIASGYRPILIDTRGHGRSMRDARPFTYELLAADVLAVLDALALEHVAVVGWSDGACIALILAMQAPARVAGVFFFGCNMDPSGAKAFVSNPIIDRCFGRHAKDYARLSATPDDFQAFVAAVSLMMETQPNYAAHDLAEIRVPVTIVQSEHDEFITREHAAYLARSIPGAELIILLGVTHFAPLQRPGQFNDVILSFLRRVFD